MQTPSPPTLQTSTAAARLYDAAAREGQYRALRAMAKVEIQYTQLGRVELVEGSTSLFASVAGLKKGDSPDELARQLAPILMASASDGLRVQSIDDRKLRSQGLESGGYDLFLEQTINGLPVIDATVNLRTSPSGEIVVISSRFVPALGVSRSPVLTLTAVQDIVARDLVVGGLAVKDSVNVDPAGELAYWTDAGKLERPVLVWVVHVSYRTPEGETASAAVSADATTGEVRSLLNDAFGMQRKVYSLNWRSDWNVAPWYLLWNESPPNFGDTYPLTMYNNVVKPRNLWAALGWNYEAVNLVAHWGESNNALFATKNGYSIIAGDDVALAVDTVAHEYGHGVYLNHAPPQASEWFSEWHAINEFYADLSAVFTDMADRSEQFADPATWQISPINGAPLRDLSFPKNPITYQAALQDYRDWYPKRSWCCNQSSVSHRNMTIYGHALYLLRHGGVHSRAGQRWSTGPFSFTGDTIPVITVPKISDNQMLKTIFVQALANMKLYNATMNGPNMKTYTANVASALWGPVIKTNVETAWKAVGIGHSCSAPPARPTYQLSPWYCKGKYDISWTQQSGVTYNAQVAPPLFSWDSYGQTITDGEVNSCQANVPSRSRFRMRACNGCGCSAWTVDDWLEYYNPCL
jgi:Zn-dependent metalloprotease